MRWYVPIVDDHPRVKLHHLSNIPPPDHHQSFSSLDLQLRNVYGYGTEESPLKVFRNRSLRDEEMVERKMRLICVSDTHNKIHRLTIPDGDLFIHCGDAVNHWTSDRDLIRFNEFVGRLPHRYKIFVSGNHCITLNPNDRQRSERILSNMIYLQDELINVEGLLIYGTPWRPRRGCLYRSEGFGYDVQRIREEKWSLIPSSIDILLTHCPPYSIRDYSHLYGDRLGCAHLLDEILQRIHPRLHLFGHIHDSFGISLFKDEQQDILFANVAMKSHRRMNQPIVIDYFY